MNEAERKEKRECSMKYPFREEVAHAEKAAMGRMYHLAADAMKPGDKLINFASGHPSTDVFQEDMIREYVNKALRTGGRDALQYGPHLGLASLRQAFRTFANAKGNTLKESDDIIITYGSVEAFSLTASALLSRGDRVVVEIPSYVNAIKCFQLHGADVIGVPIEEDGVDVDALEAAFRAGAKIFYTIPNFSNPTGITMSLAKRKAVAALANRYHVLVIEDNVYGDLRYRGTRLPNIKEFDTDGYVAYVGSVSKILAPALRIGFLAADRELIGRVIPIKAVTTNGVDPILQRAVALMFEENDIYAEIDKIIAVYREKMLTMLAAMDRAFPAGVKHSHPDGGMYIWVTMPEGTDVAALCEASATRLCIPLTPGHGFYVVHPERCTSMRLNFAKESLADITDGIERVGALMKEFI